MVDFENFSWASSAVSDARLSALDFRVLIAFALCSSETGDPTVSLAALARNAGLAPPVARGTVSALASAGYLAFTEDGDGARLVRPPKTKGNVGTPTRPRGRLDPDIMKFDTDLERLKQIGDRLERQLAAPVQKTGAAPGGRTVPSLASWNPVDGEASQPAELRFQVWLRFVLTPDELSVCKLWAALRPEDWTSWVERFSIAKATGRDTELLSELRRQFGSKETEPQQQPAPEARSAE